MEFLIDLFKEGIIEIIIAVLIVPFLIPWLSKSKKRIAAFIVLLTLGIALYLAIRYKITWPPFDEKLHYMDGVTVSILPTADHSPDSLAAIYNTLYFTENGALFCMSNMDDEKIRQIDLGGGKYEAEIIHGCADYELYVLTKPYESRSASGETELHCAIFSVSQADVPKMVLEFDVGDTSVVDFAVSDDGHFLWYIAKEFEKDFYYGFYLFCLVYDSESGMFNLNSRQQYDLQRKVSVNNEPRMIFDVDGNLYISAPEDHLILIWRKNSSAAETFAGKDFDVSFDAQTGVPDLNDNAVARFNNPTALARDKTYLYALDSGTIRRIPLNFLLQKDNMQTLAGKSAQSGLSSFPAAYGQSVAGKDAILNTNSKSSLIAVTGVNSDGYILLSAPLSSNPSQNVIYQIK